MYRGPSKDVLYQVSIHLAKRFQRRRFLEIDQPETRIEESIYFLVHLAKDNVGFFHHLASIIC
jgi:hypothetical protein